MTRRCCERCRYWEPPYHPDRFPEGECHRKAPSCATADDYLEDISTAVKLLLWWTMREWSDVETAEQQLKDHTLEIQDVMRFRSWPKTAPYDWCGDWEEKLPDEPSPTA